MSSNIKTNENINVNSNYNFDNVNNKNTDNKNKSAKFSVEEKTDKSNNKKWYIIIAVIFIILIIIYGLFFVYSYNKGTGMFAPIQDPYSDQTEAGLQTIPQIPGNGDFYPADSEVITKKNNMVDAALASIYANPNYTEPTYTTNSTINYGMALFLFIAIILFIVIIVAGMYYSSSKKGTNK